MVIYITQSSVSEMESIQSTSDKGTIENTIVDDNKVTLIGDNVDDVKTTNAENTKITICEPNNCSEVSKDLSATKKWSKRLAFKLASHKICSAKKGRLSEQRKTELRYQQMEKDLKEYGAWVCSSDSSDYED